MPIRFKKLMPLMATELNWEQDVLLLLEEDVYPYLQAQGVPPDQWLYYRDFAFRIWERRVHFNDATFQLEKTSLLNEFVWRGLNLTHLDAIQVFAEDKALTKLHITPPPSVKECITYSDGLETSGLAIVPGGAPGDPDWCLWVTPNYATGAPGRRYVGKYNPADGTVLVGWTCALTSAWLHSGITSYQFGADRRLAIVDWTNQQRWETGPIACVGENPCTEICNNTLARPGFRCWDQRFSRLVCLRSTAFLWTHPYNCGVQQMINWPPGLAGRLAGLDHDGYYYLILDLVYVGDPGGPQLWLRKYQESEAGPPFNLTEITNEVYPLDLLALGLNPARCVAQGWVGIAYHPGDKHAYINDRAQSRYCIVSLGGNPP